MTEYTLSPPLLYLDKVIGRKIGLVTQNIYSNDGKQAFMRGNSFYTFCS